MAESSNTGTAPAPADGTSATDGNAFFTLELQNVLSSDVLRLQVPLASCTEGKLVSVRVLRELVAAALNADAAAAQPGGRTDSNGNNTSILRYQRIALYVIDGSPTLEAAADLDPLNSAENIDFTDSNTVLDSIPTINVEEDNPLTLDLGLGDLGGLTLGDNNPQGSSTIGVASAPVETADGPVGVLPASLFQHERLVDGSDDVNGTSSMLDLEQFGGVQEETKIINVPSQQQNAQKRLGYFVHTLRPGYDFVVEGLLHDPSLGRGALPNLMFPPEFFWFDGQLHQLRNSQIPEQPAVDEGDTARNAGATVNINNESESESESEISTPFGRVFVPTQVAEEELLRVIVNRDSLLGDGRLVGDTEKLFKALKQSSTFQNCGVLRAASSRSTSPALARSFQYRFAGGGHRAGEYLRICCTVPSTDLLALLTPERWVAAALKRFVRTQLSSCAGGSVSEGVAAKIAEEAVRRAKLERIPIENTNRFGTGGSGSGSFLPAPVVVACLSRADMEDVFREAGLTSGDCPHWPSDPHGQCGQAAVQFLRENHLLGEDDEESDEDPAYWGDEDLGIL